MKHLIISLTLLIAFDFASANEKLRTGTIESVERNLIVLKIASGGSSHIGFLCEPEVCKLTDNFETGDDVLTTFGAVDGKNKLLDIRLCIQDDAECQLVNENMEKEQEESRIAYEKSRAKQIECQASMEKELGKDDRIASLNWFDRLFRYDQITDEYIKMLNDPASRGCVEAISDSQFEVFIEICQKHGCGDNIGGGCYHIGGYRDFAATHLHAVKQCR